MAIRAVVAAGCEAAALKSSGRSRRDSDRCARVSRAALCGLVRRGDRALRWFRSEILFGVYCWARKEWMRSSPVYFMGNLLAWSGDKIAELMWSGLNGA